MNLFYIFQGLLQFALNTTRNEDAPDTTVFNQMDPERRQFLGKYNQLTSLRTSDPISLCLRCNVRLGSIQLRPTSYLDQRQLTIIN